MGLQGASPAHEDDALRLRGVRKRHQRLQQVLVLHVHDDDVIGAGGLQEGVCGVVWEEVGGVGGWVGYGLWVVGGGGGGLHPLPGEL